VDCFYIFELNEINDLSGDLMACIYNAGEISSENLIGIPKSYFSEFYPTVFSKVYYGKWNNYRVLTHKNPFINIYKGILLL